MNEALKIQGEMQEAAKMSRILIIDQDPAFCEAIANYLKPEGFEVTSMHDDGDALRQAFAPEAGYDLILLDAGLPGTNGLEVLERIRSRLDTPVILLADHSKRMLHVVGLELGADDFLVKPCNQRELLAKIRAILRRTKDYLKEEVRQAPARIVLGDIELDAGTRVVRRNGEKVQLTAAEFNLLEILIRAAGHVVSREQLAQNVLGRELGAYDRSVDMHVSRLRRKLGHEYNGTERIITIRGAGFVYTIPNPFAA
jgi:two-component system response regulator CpxR